MHQRPAALQRRMQLQAAHQLKDANRTAGCTLWCRACTAEAGDMPDKQPCPDTTRLAPDSLLLLASEPCRCRQYLFDAVDTTARRRTLGLAHVHIVIMTTTVHDVLPLLLLLALLHKVYALLDAVCQLIEHLVVVALLQVVHGPQRQELLNPRPAQTHRAAGQTPQHAQHDMAQQGNSQHMLVQQGTKLRIQAPAQHRTASHDSGAAGTSLVRSAQHAVETSLTPWPCDMECSY